MSAGEPIVQPVSLLQILADEVRWQIVVILARGDHRVQELVERLGKPVNLVSYHLAKLRKTRLVRERRSDADARDVYYSLDLDRLRQLYFAAGDALHPSLGSRENEVPIEALGSGPRAKVLFLCTENSARSQMAEGILRHFGRGQIEVASAGSRPTRVHPLAVKVLAEQGIDIGSHRSKSLEEFRGERFDYIVTVCDRVREECPPFPGDPERIHWSFADPAAVEGGEERGYLAFQVTANELMTMIRYLLIMIERQQSEAA